MHVAHGGVWPRLKARLRGPEVHQTGKLRGDGSVAAVAVMTSASTVKTTFLKRFFVDSWHRLVIFDAMVRAKPEVTSTDVLEYDTTSVGVLPSYFNVTVNVCPEVIKDETRPPIVYVSTCLAVVVLAPVYTRIAMTESFPYALGVLASGLTTLQSGSAWS